MVMSKRGLRGMGPVRSMVVVSSIAIFLWTLILLFKHGKDLKANCRGYWNALRLMALLTLLIVVSTLGLLARWKTVRLAPETWLSIYGASLLMVGQLASSGSTGCSISQSTSQSLEDYKTVCKLLGYSLLFDLVLYSGPVSPFTSRKF